MVSRSILRTFVNNGWTIANRRNVVSQIGKETFNEISHLATKAGETGDKVRYCDVKEFLQSNTISETRFALTNTNVAYSGSLFSINDLSTLRDAHNCDTVLSTIPGLTTKIAPLQRYESGWGGFAKTTDGKIIGEFKCNIYRPYHRATTGSYPLSWINKETGLAKPYLYIDYMSTFFAEHQGYGRELMKRFYLLSVESGCEGRIGLRSAWGSDGFYNKLGFEVGENKIREMEDSLARAKRDLRSFKDSKSKGDDRWDDEISRLEEDIIDYQRDLQNPVMAGADGGAQSLYFTPTPENVAKLFSK